MILNRAETRAVSSIGWIDHCGVWSVDTATGAVQTHSLGESGIVSLHAGRQDHFAALHHRDGRLVELTVHSFDEPSAPLARLVYEHDRSRFEGNPGVLMHVPRAYAARYAASGSPDYHLLLLERNPPGLVVEPLDWYDETYDRKQHGICGVVEVPENRKLVFLIERHSEAVLYDPDARSVARKFPLAYRNGTPMMKFRQHAPEAWANDYDHLVRLDSFGWSALNDVQLQTAPPPNDLFIGHFSFDAREELCAVARPFSGDVIGLDTRTFHPTHRAETGGQPFEVALLSDHRVLARDLRTGALLQGHLQPAEVPGVAGPVRTEEP